MVNLLWVLLAGCSENWGDNAYIVEGTVLEVHANEVVLDHQAVKGLMDAMVMPFDVRDPALLVGLERGDTVYARMIIDQQGSYLEAIRETGHTDLPPAVAAPNTSLHAGESLAALSVTVEDGSTVIVGVGQDKPTALAFLYTRCPMPEFCPALVAKFQALQEKIGTDARLVTITLDPEHDTLDVLRAFATTAGAKPEVWRFGRVEGDVLAEVAGRAALSIDRGGSEIVHGSRLLVLDREGKLVERYDDNRFPLDRVAEQLRTGAPAAPAGSEGTITAN